MPSLGPLALSLNYSSIRKNRRHAELPSVLDGVEFIEVYNRSSERVMLSDTVREFAWMANWLEVSVTILNRTSNLSPWSGIVGSQL